MAAAAILKIDFQAITHRPIVDFSEILYEEAERYVDEGYMTKLQIFKMQDGGRPPFFKSLNRHISVENCPILMKFGTLHQILNPITVT